MKQLLLVLLSTTLLGTSLFGAVEPTVKEITTMKEYKALTQQNKPLALFFYAPWCGACKSMKEPYNEVARELNDKALMVKINIDNKELKPIVESFGIRSIPTIFTRKVGVQAKNKLKSSIEAIIS